MKKVAILQHRLLHYRTKFFDQLRSVCAERRIELHLVHGQASRRELIKKDEGSLPWTHKVRNRFLEIGSRDIVWQTFPAELKDVDLVVVMQESRILSNYPLLVSRLWSKRKVAYWGHGRNFQSDAPTGLREIWKSFFLTRVDWWFAYTDTTVKILKSAGYPVQRISCLDNAIDNESFLSDLASVSENRLDELRSELGFDDQSRVGLFCGSLYPDKRLDYMIEAADQIHSALPEFRLVVIGDGPSADLLTSAKYSRPWMRCVGVKKGLQKAEYFRIANLIFNPGAVGLHVLDAFCAGLPMATTVEALHGPEFVYLQDGINGVVASGDAKCYADRIIDLLSDNTLYQSLSRRAAEDAKRYTQDNMVRKFADGIEKCLTNTQ